MNLEYKYWLYYLKNNITQMCELYAYTDDKETAKKFEEFRDMKKFRSKKGFISKEEVNYLAREEMEKYLKLIHIDVYDSSKNAYNDLCMSVTIQEDVTIQNMVNNIDCGLLSRYCWIPPSIFNSEIRNALSILMYTEYYDYISHEKDIPEIHADVLSIFIKYFGKTLKNKKE